ncbi:hypothetical protein FRB94_002913 [Tulasnella sp. JGI-2019a]|nr:hypothetical protein FRB93_013933 [Tulasnella sp. JGI-2019a]KAG9013385.1 hypothetical protein FRB94_002913 [Tulasnella sp. JGI-2019a]KAG9033731.1 hypothetical protein FRB95_014418 [Tulasnella sp. JGI-2019a]
MGNGKEYGIVHDECRKRGYSLTMTEIQEGMQHYSTWVITLIVNQQHMYTAQARTKKEAIKEASIQVAKAFGIKVDVDSD